MPDIHTPVRNHIPDIVNMDILAPANVSRCKPDMVAVFNDVFPFTDISKSDFVPLRDVLPCREFQCIAVNAKNISRRDVFKRNPYIISFGKTQ